ncbi:MAG TPA: hypothetical protein VKD43_00860 [Xanthobacteraceae bacterium]|nr:hypothetical protein [Xanthobacteraceae bacterium]
MEPIAVSPAACAPAIQVVAIAAKATTHERPVLCQLRFEVIRPRAELKVKNDN